MESRKDKRAEGVLKEELSKIIYKELDLESGILVTLTKLNVSNNLQSAKVWVSVLPENRRGGVMAQLKKRLPYFQHLLVKKMNIRWVPEIIWVEDVSGERVAEMENVIAENQE